MKTGKKMRHVCLNCEQADMEFTVLDVTAQLHGLEEVVPAVNGWHCPNCGEIEFADSEGSARYSAALERIGERERAMIARTRKKLRLTQRQAAELTGGGHNAFSRYERGEARPVAAVINLFRLLDKHPELLDEIRPGRAA